MQTKQVQSKMKSISGIKKITKTMEMISVAKMKKSQNRALLSRPYNTKSQELLQKLAPKAGEHHPLFSVRLVENEMIVVVGSEKGLCGGFNAQISRYIYLQHKEKNIQSAITVGKYGEKITKKIDIPVYAVYGSLSIESSSHDIFTLAQTILNFYKEHDDIYKISIIYQKIHSGGTTRIADVQLLPFLINKDETNDKEDSTLFEPSVENLRDILAIGVIESELIQAMVESRAAEHLMRMIAMKSATDNANDYYNYLKLSYNRMRQAQITQEISEIVGGANALLEK
jgi:F-type H+-transporting ATPase subunit gamma